MKFGIYVFGRRGIGIEGWRCGGVFIFKAVERGNWRA